MKTPGFNIFFGVIALFLGLAVAAEARQVPVPTVTVTPLDGFLATSLNDRGQIVGAVQAGQGYKGVIWQDGPTVDVGANCPNCKIDGGAVLPYDINNQGQVVGAFLRNDEAQVNFSWKDGVWTELAGLADADVTIAWGLNDQGEIIGLAVGPYPNGVTGVYWESATSAPMRTQSVQNFDINSVGQIAGAVVDMACGGVKAIIEHRGAVSEVNSECLVNALATSLNDAGAVAVNFATAGTGAVFKDGQRIDLSPAPGFLSASPGPRAMNQASDVAGFSHGRSDGSPCYQQGTVWVREGTLPLPALAPSEDGCETTLAAYALNIHGQIPGQANGQAVVWHVDIDRFAPTVTVTVTPVKPAKGGAPMLFAGRVVDEVHGPSSASGLLTASYRLIDEYGLIQPSGTLPLTANGEFAMTLPLEQVKGGDKDGRHYTLEITTSDRAGNSATSTTTVIVKHGPAK